MPTERERFLGCLLGQCLGDALGFQVEGYPPDVCAAFVDDALRTGTIARQGTGRGGLKVGQYSDDSQLAREWLQSYVSCEGWDPVDYAGRVAALFTEGRIVGRGRATEAAALRLARGEPWTTSGTPAPAAGNGTAMRAAPVGLVFAHDEAQLLQVAHEQGVCTHADPRCSAGSIVIAGAVALAVREEPLDPKRWLKQLAAWARTRSDAVADSVERLEGWLGLDPEDAVVEIAPEGKPADYRERWQGISPFVTGSVLWSLYAFFRSPDDYWEAICTAVAVGGDVDTTAAMTGAISGAHVGEAGLPADLVVRVGDRGTWGHEALVRLADTAHALRLKGA